MFDLIQVEGLELFVVVFLPDIKLVEDWNMFNLREGGSMSLRDVNLSQISLANLRIPPLVSAVEGIDISNNTNIWNCPILVQDIDVVLM